MRGRSSRLFVFLFKLKSLPSDSFSPLSETSFAPWAAWTTYMLHFNSKPNHLQVHLPLITNGITCTSLLNVTKVPANHRADCSSWAPSTCFHFLIPWHRPRLETLWSLSRIPRQLFSAKPQHMFWVYQTWLTGSPSVWAIRPSHREKLAFRLCYNRTLWWLACSHMKPVS